MKSYFSFFSSWFLFLYSLSAIAELDNPFGLTSEVQFQEKFDKEIDPYWKTYGKQGNLSGVNDINISYMTFIRENEKGAIVISSGRTESYLKYKELVFDLGQQGYSVYIHDHRGQGYSGRMLDDNQKGHVNNFDDYVSDLHTFVETVVLPKSHQKLFLLAHSMGGGIATQYIEIHPDVFHAAALSSPMHAPDARILVSPEGGCWWFRLTDWVFNNWYAGFTDKPYEAKPFEKNEYTHSRVRYERLLKTYDEHKKIQLGGPTRGWASQACAASSKMLENTDKIKIPVLVLQAGADTAVTPKAQNEFCENLEKNKNDRARCYGGKPIRYEGAKHELFIESDVYRIPVVTTILRFFSEVK